MRQFASRKNHATSLAGLTINPAAILNTEVLQVSGIARTVVISIDPSALQNGDVIDLFIVFTDPSVAGIVVQVWNARADTVQLASVPSDGVQPNALLRFSADGLGGLQLINRNFPSFL